MAEYRGSHRNWPPGLRRSQQQSVGEPLALCGWAPQAATRWGRLVGRAARERYRWFSVCPGQCSAGEPEPPPEALTSHTHSPGRTPQVSAVSLPPHRAHVNPPIPSSGAEWRREVQEGAAAPPAPVGVAALGPSSLRECTARRPRVEQSRTEEAVCGQTEQPLTSPPPEAATESQVRSTPLPSSSMSFGECEREFFVASTSVLLRRREGRRTHLRAFGPLARLQLHTQLAHRPLRRRHQNHELAGGADRAHLRGGARFEGRRARRRGAAAAPLLGRRGSRARAHLQVRHRARLRPARRQLGELVRGVAVRRGGEGEQVQAVAALVLAPPAQR